MKPTLSLAIVSALLLSACGATSPSMQDQAAVLKAARTFYSTPEAHTLQAVDFDYTTIYSPRAIACFLELAKNPSVIGGSGTNAEIFDYCLLKGMGYFQDPLPEKDVTFRFVSADDVFSTVNASSTNPENPFSQDYLFMNQGGFWKLDRINVD